MSVPSPQPCLTGENTTAVWCIFLAGLMGVQHVPYAVVVLPSHRATKSSIQQDVLGYGAVTWRTLGRGLGVRFNLVLTKSCMFACGCTDVRGLNTHCSRGSMGSLSVDVCWELIHQHWSTHNKPSVHSIIVRLYYILIWDYTSLRTVLYFRRYFRYIIILYYC